MCLAFNFMKLQKRYDGTHSRKKIRKLRKKSKKLEKYILIKSRFSPLLSILRILLWLRKTTDLTWMIAWHSEAKVDNVNGLKVLKRARVRSFFEIQFFRNPSRFSVLKDTRSGAKNVRCWNLHGKVLKIVLVTLFGQGAWGSILLCQCKKSLWINWKSNSIRLFNCSKIRFAGNFPHYFVFKKVLSVAFMIKTAKCIRLKCNWNDQAQFS